MVKALINQYTENTYIINEQKEAYIIDPGARAKEIDEYITEKDLVVLGIILTHGHFDHMYSINDVQKLYQCPIYIYKDERDFLFDPNLNLSSTIAKSITVRAKSSVKLLEDSDQLKLGNNIIKITFIPILFANLQKLKVCLHFLKNQIIKVNRGVVIILPNKECTDFLTIGAVWLIANGD